MPRIIDHDAKRREVVAVARQLIMREGMQALSIRGIAEAAGSSTAIISHYFSNKNELLLHVYREDLDAARMRRKKIKRGGLEGLIGYCAEILPLTAERIEMWKISLAFTAMACVDESFAEEYRENVILAREQIRIRLQDLVLSGTADAGLDCERAARRLLATVQGVATEATIDHTDWPAERQRAVVRAEIDHLMESIVPIGRTG